MACDGRFRLLMLGGTAAARSLAGALEGDRRIALSVSVADARRAQGLRAADLRIGGFGGAAGFAAFLRQRRIGAVLDATHAFAHRISGRSAAICAAAGVPYCLLRRPAWQPGPGDAWTGIADEAGAAAHVPAGASVFIGTGRDGLAGYANLAGCRIWVRRTGPVCGPCPLPGAAWLPGTPPFTVAGETALLRDLGIDWLVVRNSGGRDSFAKLEAARRLGLSVAMIRRPDPPAGAFCVSDVPSALDWVARQLRAAPETEST